MGKKQEISKKFQALTQPLTADEKDKAITHVFNALMDYKSTLTHKRSIKDEQFKQAAYALAEEGVRIVRTHFEKHTRPTPTQEKREMRKLAKALEKATEACQRLGDSGMILLYAASGASKISDCNMAPHAVYLQKMAQLAQKACALAEGQNTEFRGHMGGRKTDERLNDAVAALTNAYIQYMGVRPTHTIDTEAKESVSPFNYFVKSALSILKPTISFSEDLINQAISNKLSLRDLEAFIPPTL